MYLAVCRVCEGAPFGRRPVAAVHWFGAHPLGRGQQGAVSGQLRPALPAQHRLGKGGRRPNPVQAVVWAEARGVS